MRRILVLLLALLIAACAGRSSPPPIAEQMQSLQMRIFLIVEEKRHRIETRAKPLMLDPQLVEAAQKHAEAMARVHAMDGQNGENNPAIKALMDDPEFQGFVGENVAQQFYHAPKGIDVDAFAQGFLDIWMKSDEHRRNLAFYGFNRTGIGVATDGKAIFVSQIFSADMGSRPAARAAAQPAPAQ